MSRRPHPPIPGGDADHGASYRPGRNGRGHAGGETPGLAVVQAGRRDGVAGLDDEALACFLENCQKVASWSAGMLMVGIAEFADRRPDEYTPRRARLYAEAKKKAEAAEAAGQPVDPPGHDEFAPDELYPLLKLSKKSATQHIELSEDLRYRLRRTLAALIAGEIDLARARIISEGTAGMSPEEAAAVEAMVLPGAGKQTYVALGMAVGRAVMQVDPVGAIKRRKRAEKRARVERWREPDGTGSLAGRNLPADDTIAADQAITQLALDLRAAGLDGPLDFLRATALMDLVIGRDSRPGDDSTGNGPGDHEPDEDWDDRDAWPDRDAWVLANHPPAVPGEEAGGDGSPPEDGGGSPREDAAGSSQQGDPAKSDHGGETDGGGSGDGGDGGGGGGDGGGPPPPKPPGSGDGGNGRRAGPGGHGKRVAAQVALTIPLTTVLGLGHQIGDGGAFGPLDPATARDLAHSAAQHPGTRWCVTVTDEQGRAVAHGCARGPQPWVGLAARDGPANSDGSAGQIVARFLDRLRVRLDPIAVDSCEHTDAEPGYVPSRKLRHKVHARTPTCSYWGCRRPAGTCDDDHTLAWDNGGLTCQCNLAPLCRRHHRMKQRDGWRLEQPRPGIMVWLTPGGRQYVTKPAIYLT